MHPVKERILRYEEKYGFNLEARRAFNRTIRGGGGIRDILMNLFKRNRKEPVIPEPIENEPSIQTQSDEIEHEGGASKESSLNAPSNLEGITVFSVGPWHVMIIGEHHVFDIEDEQNVTVKNNMEIFYKSLLRQIDNHIYHPSCLDIFIEEKTSDIYKLDPYQTTLPGRVPHLQGGMFSLEHAKDILFHENFML